MKVHLNAEKPKASASMDLEGGALERRASYQKGKVPIQAREGSCPWKGLCPANEWAMNRVDRVTSYSHLQDCTARACPWTGNVSDVLTKAEPGRKTWAM